MCVCSFQKPNITQCRVQNSPTPMLCWHPAEEQEGWSRELEVRSPRVHWPKAWEATLADGAQHGLDMFGLQSPMSNVCETFCWVLSQLVGTMIPSAYGFIFSGVKPESTQCSKVNAPACPGSTQSCNAPVSGIMAQNWWTLKNTENLSPKSIQQYPT